MPNHNIGLHHLYKNLESKKARKFFNKLIYIMITFGVLANLFQLLKIFLEKTSTGVSLISWMGYSFISLVWLIYGISNNEKPIIINSSLLFITQIITVIGIAIYP